MIWWRWKFANKLTFSGQTEKKQNPNLSWASKANPRKCCGYDLPTAPENMATALVSFGALQNARKSALAVTDLGGHFEFFPEIFPVRMTHLFSGIEGESENLKRLRPEDIPQVLGDSNSELRHPTKR